MVRDAQLTEILGGICEPRRAGPAHAGVAVWQLEDVGAPEPEGIPVARPVALDAQIFLSGAAQTDRVGDHDADQNGGLARAPPNLIYHSA